jgi:hypothetical protein
MAITVREHKAIQLAAATYRYPAAREADVLELLGWSPTVFWAVVHALIDRPDVLAAYPIECRRLQRLRESRRRQRSARRVSVG